MSEQQRRRVVITGVGAVTPCGHTAEQTWASVRNGRSGVSTVEGFEGNVRIERARSPGRRRSSLWFHTER